MFQPCPQQGDFLFPSQNLSYPKWFAEWRHLKMLMYIVKTDNFMEAQGCHSVVGGDRKKRLNLLRLRWVSGHNLSHSFKKLFCQQKRMQENRVQPFTSRWSVKNNQNCPFFSNFLKKKYIYIYICFYLYYLK